MKILNGITNFIKFINESWTFFLVLIIVCKTIYEKVSVKKVNKEAIAKSLKESELCEEVNKAKAYVKEMIYKWVYVADEYYKGLAKAGKTKRADVLEQALREFPALDDFKDTEQVEEVIKWIDKEIDNALSEIKQ